ncbi:MULTISPECIES: hypothetical protein [Cellulophaga]|uniref:Lipocalin-like domain-containing protein n=1 Tax=Cellulophaga baltica TaxID=76594 RepID=A0A1G7IDM5_9FLAO|nr:MULTISPECIES: hypothetical protein [Cellulophaga]AIY13646.1 hypothetical protein M667_10735 [Cellulophaga baltica NN016038]KGK30655.1 hypothetical protein EL45_08405 [Cellulophaga sp. E6(2014)]SDF10830.1 hypothetical protein SAMN04487992_107185 [Cellulophaga baltica]
MKKLIGLIFLMLFLVSSTNVTPLKSLKNPSLEGTWELVNRFNYDGVNVTDTLSNINGYRQVKIYSKGKVMWTRYSPDDPSEWFGYGSYSNSENNLEEQLEFGSEMMMKIQDTVQVFKFELQLDKDSFKQITVDDEGNKISSENYKRID